MSASSPEECCPRFDPEPWDGRELTLDNRRFVKDRVTSILHMPLNYGAVMTRSVARIEAADAMPQDMMMLSDENSAWGADVYLETTKEVPGATMATISGEFLCKVFEGSYGNMRKWIKEMEAFVHSKGKSPQKLYFYYTTCPKCAKKYGKNHVVILAQV